MNVYRILSSALRRTQGVYVSAFGAILFLLPRKSQIEAIYSIPRIASASR